MKTRVSLKYFVIYCLWKLFLDSNSPQTLSYLIALAFLVTLSLSHCFNLKVEQLSGKKVLNFPVLGNCFSDLFTEVEIWY